MVNRDGLKQVLLHQPRSGKELDVFYKHNA